MDHTYIRLTGGLFCFASTGSRPSPAQEITPINLRLHRPAAAPSPHTTQLAQRLHSPSPAILNFTLQNLGLISGSSPGNTFTSPQTPERANTLPSPLALHQRGLVFIKPVSPVPVQQSVSTQPLALISVQQVKKLLFSQQLFFKKTLGQSRSVELYLPHAESVHNDHNTRTSSYAGCFLSVSWSFESGFETLELLYDRKEFQLNLFSEVTGTLFLERRVTVRSI